MEKEEVLLAYLEGYRVDITQIAPLKEGTLLIELGMLTRDGRAIPIPVGRRLTAELVLQDGSGGYIVDATASMVDVGPPGAADKDKRALAQFDNLTIDQALAIVAALRLQLVDRELRRQKDAGEKWAVAIFVNDDEWTINNLDCQDGRVVHVDATSPKNAAEPDEDSIVELYVYFNNNIITEVTDKFDTRGFRENDNEDAWEVCTHFSPISERSAKGAVMAFQIEKLAKEIKEKVIAAGAGTTSSTPREGATNMESKKKSGQLGQGGEKSVETEVALTRKSVDVVASGTQIIVPSDMSLAEAVVWLQRRMREEEETIAIDEVINAFPLEGAYAFSRALDMEFGFKALVATPGMFGPNPPTMIGLEVAFGVTEQVPWGRVMVPGLEDGFLSSGIAVKDGRFVFCVGGQVKQKFKARVAKLAALVRKLVAENSIYRGQAIRVNFPDPETEQMDPAQCPKFIDLSGVRPKELIFSESLRHNIETSIMTPIKHTAMCREHKIPLKRGILLSGPYGTGKTLTANVVAKACVDNNWTFIYVDDVGDLEHAILFARQYQPAVIFAEDIDRAVTGERTDEMDKILNTIDGVDTKTNEVMVILTTNHLENINAAMLRPGRLDNVINVEPPDAEAVEKLVRLYARDLVAKGENLEGVGKKLAGQIPAVIREVVERSKLYAIARGTGDLTVTGKDLEYAADEMTHHLSLLKVKPTDLRHPMEKAASIIATALIPTVPVHPTNGKAKKNSDTDATTS